MRNACKWLAMAILAIVCAANIQAKKPAKTQEIKPAEVALSNLNDSVNYALGMLTGSEFRNRLADMNEAEKAVAITEFMDALQRGWDGKVETDGVVLALTSFANDVKSWEKSGVFNEASIVLNEKMLFQGYTNAMLTSDTTFLNEESITQKSGIGDYLQNALAKVSENDAQAKPAKPVVGTCPTKAKHIKLKTANDSINYAFGLFAGIQMREAMESDSVKRTPKDFINTINRVLKSKVQNPHLVTDAEQIGMSIQQGAAHGLVGMRELTTDFDIIKTGMHQAIMGTNTWETNEAVMYVRTTLEEIQYRTQIAANTTFLTENAKRPEVHVTPSGLQYEIITEGTGEKPLASSRVRVHYEGRLIDGTVFDSSYQRGEPITFGLNQVIQGWTEGLQLMSVGSKYKLYIPQELGYGSRNAGSIPAYSTLIFVVELLDIE